MIIAAAGISLDVAAQTKPATAGASEACSLLTKQDAVAALGGTVEGPKSTSGMPMGDGSTVSSCEYSGSGLSKVHLNLMLLSPATLGMYQGICAQQGHDGLAGLGELACWYSPKHEELQVLKGNKLITVELRKSGDPTEAIKGIAKKAVELLR
jgi:hypothetical protein